MDEGGDDGANDDDEDEDEDANSSSDEEMTTSQWLTLCYSWQKGEVVLDDESSLVFRGRVSIGHFC